MDWKNKLHNIENNIKNYLFAKKLDNLASYYIAIKVLIKTFLAI